MAFGLAMQTDRATALQSQIESELVNRGLGTEPDSTMAEYVTILIINNKTPEQIKAELVDLANNEGDISGFVDWLFEQASKGAPEAAEPAAAEPSSSSQPPRDSPPHQAADNRRLPNGPRTGAPLYQQALSQAIPTTSPTAQKRTASARSPSPAGRPAAKSRRTDLPTGPRAMQRDRDREGHGQRSLLDRMGPRGGHGPHFNQHDDVQARIDSITNGSPDPNMMMMNGGFPMNGMGGMDMAAMSMANPMMLQELMMSQMAMMSQIAGAIGIMNPATGQFMNNGGFPMQPGMEMNPQFNGMNGGMGQGGVDGNGRGRGRGRGGSTRGAGRGRGGHTGHHSTTDAPAIDSAQAAGSSPSMFQPVPPIPATVSAPAIIAPTPLTPSSSIGSARPGFVAPERPQSPTLCKFGTKCSNPVCRYSHPSPVATAESGVVLSTEACERGKDCKDKDCVKSHVSPAVLNPNAEVPKSKSSTYIPTSASAPTTQNAVPCRYGAACTRPGCSFSHPRPASNNNVPCKFGAGCTRATCQFQHPAGRVLPTAFHRGLSTTGGTVSVPNPETGSMGAASHHKSVTFKRPDGTPTTAAELERQVKEMEQRKNEAQKAIAQAQAGKKEDPSPAVPISA
ncbi:hypothetical protein OH76DRAFT_1556498 [Lentinus brumalis]|uniref:Nab2 type CCCH zinc finger 4 domain-containing protein n=1 Tax=Lentinus brumalis TaxID=2498619 RepID=A0A371D9U0_9APHY|nr:hypothetical protein OH76DRAFT_1556498 [Polyporus brumalis]